ncbi:hypothetical protein [Azospirillum brasilense]|uniref:hypothetical protein n=1 Tax=Azospirillum brasilense TaxID=192 RepID=UPI0011C36F72|nr:hypothetical protein [Azospirillum brasilense]NUB24323.1 hypothetical protein [Azospirillum brasilense]NUB34105.1 hypothetical protein [Azospirillum brasilense]
MRRALFTATTATALLFALKAVAGPFGIEMGIQADTLGVTQEKAGGIIHISPPSDAHPLFDSYTVIAPKETGVCKVQATTPEIPTNVYGDGIKSQFQEIRSSLDEIYGKGKNYDFLRRGSIWNEHKDWMMGLLKKERELTSYWSKETKSRMKDNIVGVTLEAFALGPDSGMIIIRYEFSNFPECIKVLKSKSKGKL